MTTETPPESRWRNYQQLIWTQQQIHLQIQQQQQLQRMAVGGADVGDSPGILNMQTSQQQQQPQPPPPQQQQPPPPSQQQPTGQNKSNAKPNEEKPKEILDPWDTFPDAHSAFLGPSLWDKRLPYDENSFKLEYMELEDFLQENGIPVDSTAENGFLGAKNNNGSVQQQQQQHQSQQRDLAHSSTSPPIPFSVASQFMAGPSHLSGISPMRSMASSIHQSSRSPSPSGSSSCGSRDATPTVSPDSTQTAGLSVAKMRLQTDSPFSLAEMALGSVPGQESFDPRTRAFTDDELKPQPMIKKSKKQFVPDECKDAKYWSRRRKNNMAAKRSRDARRVKENQIAMRAGFLEKENQVMKEQVDRMKEEVERTKNENIRLKEQLSRCHREH